MSGFLGDMIPVAAGVNGTGVNLTALNCSLNSPSVGEWFITLNKPLAPSTWLMGTQPGANGYVVSSTFADTDTVKKVETFDYDPGFAFADFPWSFTIFQMFQGS